MTQTVIWGKKREENKNFTDGYFKFLVDNVATRVPPQSGNGIKTPVTAELEEQLHTARGQLYSEGVKALWP